MTDQKQNNLAFEILTTNQSLQTIATIIYELIPRDNQALCNAIDGELRTIQLRINRLHSLTRPKNR